MRAGCRRWRFPHTRISELPCVPRLHAPNVAAAPGLEPGFPDLTPGGLSDLDDILRQTAPVSAEAVRDDPRFQPGIILSIKRGVAVLILAVSRGAHHPGTTSESAGDRSPVRRGTDCTADRR